MRATARRDAVGRVDVTDAATDGAAATCGSAAANARLELAARATG